MYTKVSQFNRWRRRKGKYSAAMSLSEAMDASLTLGDSSASNETRTWTASVHQTVKISRSESVDMRKRNKIWLLYCQIIVPGAAIELPELDDAMREPEEKRGRFSARRKRQLRPSNSYFSFGPPIISTVNCPATQRWFSSSQRHIYCHCHKK